ncbi:glycosyltransferase [Alloscardovia venturai]|uniref:Glycosyltransferase n=2 Tax=Alloscardovia venturai TaxID=1769421 RepID=A0ABW2Y5F3_9BIFI
MSVYSKDRFDSIRRAITSITTDQICKPAEVIIIEDGPVAEEVEAYLSSLESSSAPITIIRLPHNRGLAHALNVGVRNTSTDWIARMDADDYSLPYRFERQVTYLESHLEVDVLGSALQEFTEPQYDHIIWGEKRLLPRSSSEISAYARFQSPVHHPTVMIRKSALLSVDGYPEDSGHFEDYQLWERMLLNGAQFANISEVLLGYRVDSGAYNRRGGWHMMRDEIALQKQFYKDGFTSRSQFIRNVIIRGLYRLVPTSIKKPLYRLRTAVKNHNTV